MSATKRRSAFRRTKKILLLSAAAVGTGTAIACGSSDTTSGPGGPGVGPTNVGGIAYDAGDAGDASDASNAEKDAPADADDSG